MATKIITKNGSGAPLSGDLSQGELAVDLTNKQLYTKNSSGVVKLGGSGNSGEWEVNGDDIYYNDGNVGIGTDDPKNPLHIKSSVADHLTLEADSTTIGPNLVFANADGNLARIASAYPDTLRFEIGPTNSAAMIINADGKVGIGTNPNRKLHVAGDDEELLRVAGASAQLRVTSRDTKDINLSNPAGGSSMSFATNGSDRLTIDADGNVGIGEEVPLNQLHITAQNANYSTMRLDATANTIPANYGFRAHDGVLDIRDFVANTTPLTINGDGNVGINTAIMQSKLHIDVSAMSSSTDAPMISFSNGRPANRYSAIGQVRGSSSNQVGISFYTTNNLDTPTEKMRITANGRIGIGTKEALAPVHLYTEGESSRFLAEAQNGSNTVSGHAEFLAGTSSCGIIRKDDKNFNFWVQPFADRGTDSNVTPQMTLDTAGNLLLGTTKTPFSLITSANTNGLALEAATSYIVAARTNSDSAALYLNKGSYSSGTTIFAQFNTGSVQRGSIDFDGTTTNYNTSSDERLKENIVDAPAGNIDDIRVRSFNWKESGKHQTYGMIAQELVDVAPEAVSQGETEEDMWGVDFSTLVPMMIKEIQDLKAEVATLKGAN